MRWPAQGSGAASLALALGLLAAPESCAHAASDPGPAERGWLSAGALFGTTLLDARFTDYQWNVAPHGAFGLEARAGRGRFSGGLRVWRTAARQEIGAAAGVAPAVRGTSLELTARARCARVAGASVLAVLSGGGLRLEWDPDRVAIAAGPGAPVEVALAPVDAWIAGGGVAVERGLGAAWSAGLAIERRVFALETARGGQGQVEIGSETFGDWSARLSLARVWWR